MLISSPCRTKLLDGNFRPGTSGALSVELLARIGQVGIEPTTSRVSSEVTLSYTTSNFVALAPRIHASNSLLRPDRVGTFFPAPARTADWSAIRAGQLQAGRNSRSE
jgi:hypothetical protein